MKKKSTRSQKLDTEFEEEFLSDLSEIYDDKSLELDENGDAIEDDEEDEIDEIVSAAYSKADYEEIIDPVTGKKKKIYVDPAKLDAEIAEYYNTGVITDELAKMVNDIAVKLSFAPNFINYSYRRDMVGDALVRMMKALQGKKYKVGNNPFSYYTRIAFNCFRSKIKKENHALKVLEEYRVEHAIHSENYNSMVKNNRIYSEKSLHSDD